MASHKDKGLCLNNGAYTIVQDRTYIHARLNNGAYTIVQDRTYIHAHLMTGSEVDIKFIYVIKWSDSGNLSSLASSDSPIPQSIHEHVQ